MTFSKKYCYTHSSCSGLKATRHGRGVMTFDRCCSTAAPGSNNGWGIYDGQCTACLEGSDGDDHRSALRRLAAPHGQFRR